MEQRKKNIFILMAGIVIIAAFTRLINHPANVSPVMAIAIFSGAYFSDKRFALIIPIASMLISDAFLGYYLISIFVYLSFALGIFIGFLIKSNIKIHNVLIASLTGSVLFFIITNFGSWLIDPMYLPLTTESFLRCYQLAIPFFRNTLLGDLAYVSVIFGSYALAERYLPKFVKQ